MTLRVQRLVPPKFAGYRKFAAFGLVMIAGALLQAFGRLDATFVTLAATIYGLYVGGNVGEHATQRGRGGAVAHPPGADRGRPGAQRTPETSINIPDEA